MKKFKMGMQTRKNLQAYTFVSPFIIGILMFFMYPIYTSIKLSFGTIVQRQGFIIKWTGMQNYFKAFFIDTDFIPTFLQTVQQMFIRTPLIIIFALIISIVLNKKIAFKGLFRVIFFLPFLLGTGEVIQQILNLGIDKQVLSNALHTLVPMKMLAYLGTDVVTMAEGFFGEIVIVLWSSGVQILLFLSGLQSIPVSLYESAKVDGATEWEMFWKITFPMIIPMLVLNIVYTMVDLFTYIGNPILTFIESTAFKHVQFEYAAAVGWIYFIFIIIIILLVLGIVNYFTSYSDRKWEKKND